MKKEEEKRWSQLQELVKLTGRVAFKEDPKDTLGVSINLATFIIGGALHDMQVV